MLCCAGAVYCHDGEKRSAMCMVLRPTDLLYSLVEGGGGRKEGTKEEKRPNQACVPGPGLWRSSV